jgi:hypothetical protein
MFQALNIPVNVSDPSDSNSRYEIKPHTLSGSHLKDPKLETLIKIRQSSNSSEEGYSLSDLHKSGSHKFKERLNDSW